MNYYGYNERGIVKSEGLPDNFSFCNEWVFFCKPHEVLELKDEFGLDESTVRDCADLDESVRYNSFIGYDFISMVHIEIHNEALLMREINIYVSRKFLILVVPNQSSPVLSVMEKRLMQFAATKKHRDDMIPFLYYQMLHHLLVDFSDTLETLEDKMEALSGEIVVQVRSEHFSAINNLRNMAFAAKKHLRGLCYIGDQILMDDNKLFHKRHVNYFKSINSRFYKQYDFAESLYMLSGEIIHSFDSRLTMKTNETINKLTALTLLFGPMTVITGIYGMNFDNMPELAWRFGYPIIISAMLIVCVVIYLIMKKKRWF